MKFSAFLLSVTVFFIFIFSAHMHAEMSFNNSPYGEVTKVFYHDADIEGWKAVIKGKIISIGMREDRGETDVFKSETDTSKAGVRLYSKEGIKNGDELFVINDKNLVVARLSVQSIFKSATFGYMLIGYGNLRFARNGDRVVQRVQDEYSQYAYIHKGRGDYYDATGDSAEAIHHYKKAIELDKGNPEAHLGLGIQFLRDNLLQFAFREFEEAYKNFGRLYDNEDKYELLKSMAETRYRQVYLTAIPQNLRKTYIKDGIRYAKEALAIYPESKDANFYLGMFYYKNPEPSDVDARNHLLKVIGKDPENIDAYLILAELYYNHKNMNKARQYAEQALKINPANERARFINNLVKEEND